MPSFRLQADESLAEGLRRVTLDQLQYARRALEQLPVDAGVHEARKSVKRVRAVLRLTRSYVGDGVYGPDNARLRDVGRTLGPARDAAVLLQTFDALIAQNDAEPGTGVLEDFRHHLADRQRALENEINETVKREVLGFLDQFNTRVADWASDPNRPAIPDDFAATAQGFRRIYRQGRKRMTDAQADPSTSTFHLWRKRVRYLSYQVHLISESSAYLADELAPDLAELAVGLGTEHDLAVLSEMAGELPDLIQDEASRWGLLKLLEQHRLDLQAAMGPIGRRIYLETPRQFVDSLGVGWEKWKLRAG
jgi:CHAD domain-containing protein